MKKRLKNIGPGALIAAAFIGPGTVTLCTLAGVNYGFSLLWVMSLSIIATIVLQEMAARVGIITQKGLALVIREQIKSNFFRKLAIVLILSAILVGNAAYEAGNISGASLGMSAVFGADYYFLYPFIIGAIAFVLLYKGTYKLLERSLIVLVLLMSVSFISTAIITKPNVEEVLKGLFVPEIPEGSLFTLIGLLGTTIVPYNLFLHASLVKEKWKSPSDLKYARKDTILSIVIGGLVSISIIIAATSITNGEIKNVVDLAKGLEPVYGKMSTLFLGLGLFAAGITSAITAPLAASYVANSCFDWNVGLKHFKFRFVWMLVLLLGVVFSSFKINPIEIIKFAQVANGLLLPVIALFLWWVVNKTDLLGTYKNTIVQNVLSGIIILITIVLGVKSILKVFELL